MFKTFLSILKKLEMDASNIMYVLALIKNKTNKRMGMDV